MARCAATGCAIRARTRGFPILVPAPGQRDVALTCGSEKPFPSRDAAFYERPRGYAVSVWYRGLYGELDDARVELHRADDPDGTPLPGDLFSAEEPYTPDFSDAPMTCFVAKGALDRGTWYTARFTATDDDERIDFSWTFRTK